MNAPIKSSDLIQKCEVARANLDAWHENRVKSIIDREIASSKKGFSGWWRKLFGKELSEIGARSWAWEEIMTVRWAYDDMKRTLVELLAIASDVQKTYPEETIELSRQEYHLLCRWEDHEVS